MSTKIIIVQQTTIQKHVVFIIVIFRPVEISLKILEVLFNNFSHMLMAYSILSLGIGPLNRFISNIY